MGFAAGAVKTWDKPRFAQFPVSGTVQVHRGAPFIRPQNAANLRGLAVDGEYLLPSIH
jgi:hypothetical protein